MKKPPYSYECGGFPVCQPMESVRKMNFTLEAVSSLTPVKVV